MDTLVHDPEESLMQVLDPTGHTQVKWKPSNPEQVAAARAMFEEMVTRKRYSAFRVDPETKQRGERMETFDPEAKRMVLVPHLVGG